MLCGVYGKYDGPRKIVRTRSSVTRTRIACKKFQIRYFTYQPEGAEENPLKTVKGGTI